MIGATGILPDTEAIRADLAFMTRRWGELPRSTKFEVRAFRENSANEWAQFSTSRIDDAVAWIDRLNCAGFNIYAVRNPIRIDHKGPATDESIEAAFYAWADCDDHTATSNVLQFTGPKWTAAVTTGHTPSTRVHIYWELTTPCFDLSAWRTLQIGIAAHFKSDPSVINASRIMRVGGTISHPASKKLARGYIEEACTIRTEYDDPREPVDLERLIRVFGAAKPDPWKVGSGEHHRKTAEDYTNILRRARTDGEKHTGVRDLAASLAGQGVKRSLAEAIIRDACPVWDANVENLIRTAYEKYAVDDQKPDREPLPAFNVAAVDRHSTCEAIRRLLAEHHRLFAFGGSIVEVDRAPIAGLFEDADKTIPASFPRPMPITKDRIVGHLEQVCRWHAKVETAKFDGWVDKPAPEWAARLIAHGSAEKFPPLAGVIRHPVIDASNQLRAGMLGYDPRSQYFIQAPIPCDIDKFSWASATAALDWLVDDWLGEFCWNDRADAYRAVMLCLTLLKSRMTLAREGKFPGFLVTAPMASTGKTELVECLTRAITGEGIPFSAFPVDDDAEMNKLLMSIIISDPSCFCFDNIKNGHSIRSAVLDQYITRDTFQGRLLGTNQMGDFPALAVVIATGNNIEAAEDSSTRFVEIRLQPKDDNPQNTVFLHDAKAHTNELRPRILSALRKIAQHPHTIPQKGRFPAWFHQVAGPVMELSGNRGLLDAWEQTGTTIRNGDALEDFLLRIKATGIDPISASEIVTYAFPEYAALVGSVKPEYYEAITSTPASDDLEGLKRREAAKNLVARYVMANLKPWRDQIAGGYRLRFTRWTDARNRKRDFVSLSGKTKNETEHMGELL